jgi:DNA-binding MarR family transcriptional regulator
MEHEYQVLAHLQENEETTQRKISSRTGLSLGAVNLLLKKMVRKGLIKVEKLSPRSVRYILTPQGMQEKARLTYSYIRQSYHQLLKIYQTLDELLATAKPDLDGRPVIIFGPADEICEILTQHLTEQSQPYNTCTEKADFIHTTHQSDNQIILIWREEEEEQLGSYANSINIMKVI